LGDVTTTMLWIGGQITASNIIFKLFLPSLVCLLAPLLVVSSKLKGELSNVNNGESLTFNTIKKREQNFVFFSGIGVFLFVPVFHAITHLPPYMGILFGVGFLWIITAFLHKKKSHNEKQKYSVTSALKKIDTSGILFFLGILLAVAVLQNTALLANVANTLSCQLKNNYLITIILGLLSAIIDNVPLVAATMGMFNLEQYPTNHVFWELLAFTTGTGGSIFIIGSAAGIAVMGVEDISFIQYLKKISVLALIGFLLGVGTFWILN
ncbi:MAG: sodium:proton antiporter, partial [Bacteroidia bacterium]|nr:sodium:proton antiporter [Bacteroidia bacterium]